MNLEIGQVLFGMNYKYKRLSLFEDLIIGLKLMKPKIKRITENYLSLDVSGDEQKISKKRIGKSIFLTEKEAVEYIISETKRRLSEIENRDFKQKWDRDSYNGIKKDLKKWEKYALGQKSVPKESEE